MNWRDVLAVLLGVKKPKPILVPIPKQQQQTPGKK